MTSYTDADGNRWIEVMCCIFCDEEVTTAHEWQQRTRSYNCPGCGNPNVMEFELYQAVKQAERQDQDEPHMD